MIQATSTKMPQEFNSLMELMDYFSDEAKCLNYLLAQRFDGAITCPHCGGSKIYCFADGLRFKCGSCRQQFTAKVGTIFEGSKIPMRKWFIAIYLVTSHKKGISSHQLAKDIKVTQKTGWFMLHRIRFALGQGSFETPMGSGGNTVEIDEAYIGGRTSNMHEEKRKATRKNGNKTIVMGFVERETKTVRTFVIPNTTSEVMQPMVLANVAPDAQLVTDAHASYKPLYKWYDNHSIIKTKLHNHKTVGEKHTNNIEGYWSLFQRSIIGIYHHVSSKHMQAYCDESAYRYNTRLINEGSRVKNTVSKTNGKRLTYNALIGK